MSPLLFAVAIEPFACLFCGSTRVAGFCRGQEEEKLFLYTDIMLLFLNDTQSSLQKAMLLLLNLEFFQCLKLRVRSLLFSSLDPLPVTLTGLYAYINPFPPTVHIQYMWSYWTGLFSMGPHICGSVFVLGAHHTAHICGPTEIKPSPVGPHLYV